MSTPNKAAGTGVAKLLERGVPVGPLHLTNRFYKTDSGSKYHATQSCSRLSGRRRATYSAPVMVDLLKTDDSRFCVDCVTGPTSTAATLHVQQATRILDARNNLSIVRARVAADQADHAPDGDAPVGLATLDLATVHRTSWLRVTEALAVRGLLASVCEDPQTHPDMLTWAEPTFREAVALTAHLESLAAAATDTGMVTRACVVDLLGDLPSSGGPDKITAPVPNHPDYPAICGNTWSTRATGYKEKVNEAWQSWTAHVKHAGDLPGARDAAMAAGSVAALVPEHVPQLPTGPAQTPMPASGSPWEWLVAEWRTAATAELTAIITGWEEAYTAALAAAQDLPAKVIGLRDWDLAARTRVNATTELLAGLQVTVDQGKTYALAVVPGVVASWLAEFGTNGSRGRGGYAYQATTGKVIDHGDATSVDGPGTFETALRMWEPVERNRVSANPMHKLETVLDIARGIHAAGELHPVTVSA